MFNFPSLKNLFRPKAVKPAKAEEAVLERLGMEIRPLMPSREEYRREVERHSSKGRQFG